MYQKVKEEPRMTDIEGSIRYPDSYIIMRRDNMDSETGTVLYLGDNMGELISLAYTLEESFYGIVEGLNHQRSLGGVVVGG